MNGLGVLQPLLSDDRITDVLVVGDRGVWVERDGQLAKTEIKLESDDVNRLIERIVSPLGMRIDRASPMVDARLPDGSRVHAIVPPLAVDGPCLTIRRFRVAALTLADFAPKPGADALSKAVQARKTILVSGGTGSGKTSLLNALLAHAAPTDRVITVEDAAELKIPLCHVVRLEARLANSEGVGRVTIRDLVRNALRMRPDRLIVGEVRGGEAVEMLQAMNTGHAGSMSTLHANSATDALRRLETMVLMSDVALPLEAVRRQIVSALDLVIHLRRDTNGRRHIAEVGEVVDVNGEPCVQI